MKSLIKRLRRGRADTPKAAGDAGTSPSILADEGEGAAPQRSPDGQLMPPEKKAQLSLLQQVKALLEGALHIMGRQHKSLSNQQTRMLTAISGVGERAGQLASDLAQLEEGQEGRKEALAESIASAADALRNHMNGHFNALQQRIGSLEQRLPLPSEEEDAVPEGPQDEPAPLDGKPASLQTEMPEEVVEIGKEQQETEAPPDLLLAVGMSVPQYDEFIREMRNIAGNCPEACFATKLAGETLSRLEGMRAETISLLAMHDVGLIDSVERFDPSRHRPVGTCQRPEAAQGDGEIKRVGLVRLIGDKEKVIRPALVVLFDDVKT